MEMEWNLKYQELQVDKVKIRIKSLTFGELQECAILLSEKKINESNLLILKYGIIKPEMWKEFPEKIDAQTALIVLKGINKLTGLAKELNKFNPSRRKT